MDADIRRREANQDPLGPLWHKIVWVLACARVCASEENSIPFKDGLWSGSWLWISQKPENIVTVLIPVAHEFQLLFCTKYEIHSPPQQENGKVQNSFDPSSEPTKFQFHFDPPPGRQVVMESLFTTNSIQ